jgi:hypothetical protein
MDVVVSEEAHIHIFSPRQAGSVNTGYKGPSNSSSFCLMGKPPP